jgi:hypothetical protein
VAVLKAQPKKIVQYALPLLQRQLVAPFVVTRIDGQNFKGAKGDTVNMRIPGLTAVARDYEWRTRNNPIVLDDIEGLASMPVKLNKHVVSATALTDEHLTMDEISLTNEVVGPQVEAIAADYEAKVVAGLRSAAVHPDLVLTPSLDTDPHLAAIESKRLMDSKKVAPTSGRVFLIGSDVAAAWLASDRLSQYTSTGQEGTPALRDAIIGRLAGAPVIEHNGLNPNEAYYLSPSALLLANLSPVIPNGVVSGAQLSNNGYAMRLIFDYDAAYLRDRSVVSSYLGLNDVRDERTADGKWIYEEGDLDDDEYPTGATVNPVGTRKNVRIVKLTFSGSGSVLA